jgi:HlyD family secretion protein
VQQVRLQSTTADNIVNYTVVVTLDNPGGVLLPGMTARVDFLVKSAENVLRVPNAALRFRPSDEVLAHFAAARTATHPTPPGVSTPAPARGNRDAAQARRAEAGASGTGTGTLYSLDAAGTLRSNRVRTGITDGLFTEVQGPALAEGLRVIDGLLTASPQPAAAAANPMGGAQQGGQQGGRGRGAGF